MSRPEERTDKRTGETPLEATPKNQIIKDTGRRHLQKTTHRWNRR